MQWLSFTKVEKVMLKLQNDWIWTAQRCGRLWRSSRRPETTLTDQGGEENGVSPPLNSPKARRKSCNETIAEAAKLSHRSQSEQIHHASDVEGRSGVKPFKVLHRQELTANHVAMRTQKCRGILQEMADGTLPNLVFTIEKKFDIQEVVKVVNDRVWSSSSSPEWRIVTRRQIRSLSYLSGRHRDRKVHSFFCALWTEIELPALHRGHFGGLPAALAQEALPRSSQFAATGLCACFQDHSVLDSEENPLIHKHGSLACKELWPSYIEIPI